MKAISNENGIKLAFVKRGRLEIIYEILMICRKPVNKTRILYKCNLSFELLKKYIGFLLSQNLIQITSKGLYQTTGKGREFIKDYEHIENLLETENL